MINKINSKQETKDFEDVFGEIVFNVSSNIRNVITNNGEISLNQHKNIIKKDNDFVEMFGNLMASLNKSIQNGLKDNDKLNNIGINLNVFNENKKNVEEKDKKINQTIDLYNSINISENTNNKNDVNNDIEKVERRASFKQN